MRSLLKTAGFASVLISFCAVLHALPAKDVEPLDNRDYFPKLHEMLSASRSSIRVLMFSAAFYGDIPSSPTNVIIEDLLAAAKRGVAVTVVLERGGKKTDADLNRKNGEVKRILEKGGVVVYNDLPKVTTHSKLIIIDDHITVIGSTNWSYSAVMKNNETSVAIYSKEVALHYIEYFNGIIKSLRGS